MTPESQALIASYPDLDPEQAKLVFLRDSAMKAFVENRIREATESGLSEILQLGTVASMSKEEIGVHIANLEKCRNYLSALIQGLKKGHASEVEPRIKEKHELEEKAKRVAKPKSLEDRLSALGISPAEFIASLGKLEGKAVPSVIKPKCDKCGKEVFSLKYHSC